MFAALSLAVLATSVFAAPLPRGSGLPSPPEPPKTITCSTIFTGPLAYSFTPRRPTVPDAQYGTYVKGKTVYVNEAAAASSGEDFLFQTCNSNYMGYAQNPPAADYGHVVEKSTGRCLQVPSIPTTTDDVTPKLGPCSYADDDSQLLQYWALEGPPPEEYLPYALHFLGEQYNPTDGAFGLDFRAEDPEAPQVDASGSTFKAVLTKTIVNGNIFYLVQGPNSAGW